MSFEKTFDEIERAAVVPMQLVAPVRRFFFEERLKLAHCGLAEINDIHEGEDRRALAGTVHHSWQMDVNEM